MDTPERIAESQYHWARQSDGSLVPGLERSQETLAHHIRSYGEQCRRAGAEAVQRQSAQIAFSYINNHFGPEHGKACADAIRTIPLPSPAEAASPAAGWRPTHRHYKGGLYRKLFEGTFESNLLSVVVYQNEEGRVWVRPLSEFNGYVVTEDGAGKEPRFASFWPSPPNTEDARGG